MHNPLIRTAILWPNFPLSRQTFLILHDILEDGICGRGLEADPSGAGVALVARVGGVVWDDHFYNEMLLVSSEYE
jgi:hypothetical protein